MPRPSQPADGDGTAPEPSPEIAPGRPGALGMHWAGLDGLRGVAVIGVVLFHGRVDAVAGGFLGVSTFFTLSGFLITSLLLAEHRRTGRVHLPSFWARRARRLLPASLVTIGAVCLVAPAVWNPAQLHSLRGDALAAVAYVANWRFLTSDQSYAALFSDPSPLQHFWSLAIEEQFYVVYPLAAAALLGRRGRAGLAAALAAVVVGALILHLAAFDPGGSPDRVYYGTDSRAAELAVGGLAAIVLAPRRRGPGRGAGRPGDRRWDAAGAVGLVVTLALYATADDTDTFLWRGGLLVLSLATAAVIGAVVAGDGTIERLLGTRPLAAVGRVSYGAYLYHWPLFLWLDEARTGLEGIALLAVRLAATGAIAALSYRALEQPIRRGALRPGEARRALAAAMAVVVAAALLATLDPPDTGFATGGAPAPAAPTLDVVVLGDASAADLAEALDAWGGSPAVRAVAVTDTSCPTTSPSSAARPTTTTAARASSSTIPVADGTTGTTGESGGCAGLAVRWRAAVRANRPDVVVVTLSPAWDPVPALAALGLDGAEPDSSAARTALQTLWSDALDAAASSDAHLVAATVGYAPTMAAFRVEIRERAATDDDTRLLRLDTDEAADPARAGEVLAGVLASYVPGGALPRVMVVGDSVGHSLGRGFERWAATSGDAIVWNDGLPGCGVFQSGRYRNAEGVLVTPPNECGHLVAHWASGIERFRPDVVVVVTGAFDLAPRRFDDADADVAPGDDTFDDELLASYREAIEVWTAHGAEVVWTTVPCVDPTRATEGVAPVTVDDAARRHLHDTLLPTLVARRPDVRIADVARLVCPDDEMPRTLDGEALRDDMLHYNVDGATWLATRLADEVLAAARA